MGLILIIGKGNILLISLLNIILIRISDNYNKEFILTNIVIISNIGSFNGFAVNTKRIDIRDRKLIAKRNINILILLFPLLLII